MKKRYSVLTFVFGAYEPIHEIPQLDSDAEYILVTDTSGLKSETWNIVYDSKLDGMSIVDKCYYVRYHPFEYCNTDLCFRLDGSIYIKQSLGDIVDRFEALNADLMVMLNPVHNYLHEDYPQWIRERNYPVETAEKAMCLLDTLGYDPTYAGYYQVGVSLVRNNKLTKNLDELTYSVLRYLGTEKQIERFDQPIWSFILNKFFEKSLKVMPVTEYLITASKYLQWCWHNTSTAVPFKAFQKPSYLFNKIVECEIFDDISQYKRGPLVSIIIPCYNVAPYIRRCLDSVVRQTHQNLDVILVDDCSTDETIANVNGFLSEYRGYMSIRVIQQEQNLGVSSARNRGIREAVGEYIFFLDSDDSISTECIELLIKPMMDNADIEMVVGNYKIIGPLHFTPFSMSEGLYYSQEIVNATFTNELYGMVWNKLYRKDFILRNELFFIDGLLHEDLLWVWTCAICLNKVYVIRTMTYNYYVHQNSITTKGRKLQHQEHRMAGILSLIDFIFNKHVPDKKDVRGNAIVYRYIEAQLQELLMDPILEGREDISRDRYRRLRQQNYWSLSNIMAFSGMKFKERTRYLHWLMPESQGYRYYRKRHLKHHYLQPEINQMKLTVITINYNNLKGLQRTVPSIISQTYTGYEYIVVDGGSTDGSKEYIASQERIDYWVSESDKGIYNAMNKAVQMAHGEYCLFMNSGDTFFSAQVLEQTVHQLGTYDYIGGCSVYVEGQKAYPFIPPKELNLDFLLVNALCHQSLFTKTAVLRKYPFNESHRIVSDWEQYFRAWYINDCTFAPLQAFISIFYLDGISVTNKSLDAKERDEVICRIIKDCEHKKSVLLRMEYDAFLGKKSALSKDKENTIRDMHKEEKRIRHKARLKQKVEKAFFKRSPLMRDLALAKYGLKFFFKDLFL